MPEQELVPIPSQKEVFRCQFHEWYANPELQRRSIKSIVVDVPLEFLAYLSSDGIILPPCAQDDTAKKTVFLSSGGNDEISDFDYTVSGDPLQVDVTPEPRQNRPDFPQLDLQLRAALADLGGEVFCKTNWSAPCDAAWINANSLKCRRTADIYLLLKSSNRTAFDFGHMMLTRAVPPAHDVTSERDEDFGQGQGQAQAQAPDRPVVVLRKWANLNPAMEFRLFVSDGSLVGISQRDVTTCYSFLADDDSSIEHSEKMRLFDLMLDWFCGEDDASTDKEWLTSAIGLPTYIADVYIDKRDRIFLIDVNVFGYPSDPLLFDWGELIACSSLQDVPFRSVQRQSEVKASVVGLGCQQMPIDVSLAPDFSRFIQIVKDQEAECSSDDDA
jgi:hypothetical protein